MIKREVYTFNGISELPNISWHIFFSKSVIGKDYEILWNTDTKELMMSNTEFEWDTNKFFFDSIFSGCKILSIGYGIGFINNIVRKRNAHLTVIEKDQRVIDLEKDNIDDIRIIIGDGHTLNYNDLFTTEKFDIVYWDPSGGNENLAIPFDQLELILKPDGKLIVWTNGGSLEK